MPITWRASLWSDIEAGLSIEPSGGGDYLRSVRSSLDIWKHFFKDPFFTSVVLEADPPIRGHRSIGFGSALAISSEFADAEIANPRPDLTARVIDSVRSGCSVLATMADVSKANARKGIDVLILHCIWRDELVSEAERHEIQTILPSSLAEVLAGFRIRRILAETTWEPVTEFFRRSVVYLAVAEFPETGRTLHLMTNESVKKMPGSLGNVIFRFSEPVLRLRESDQELLLAALKGATDGEIAVALKLTAAAVKARWRSSFARVAEVMPGMVDATENHNGRGLQKRHRLLAYVRSHPEELRPYDWKLKARVAGGAIARATAAAIV